MTSTTIEFKQLGLAQPILQALEEIGYETPSPIQAEAIPHLLNGLDLLGQAQTGTGKTAAFALPALTRIDVKLQKPQVLVLTPTRELALQVAEAFQTYARHLKNFHVLPVYGGQGMGAQLHQLKRGAHVIVGTPGRVMDHLRRQTLSLENLQTLVLDEADEMLNMGFLEDVEWILEHTPATRQTALFSATMPDAIKRVAQKYLKSPQEVKIKTKTTTVSTIEQRFVQTSVANKIDALTRVLEVEEFDAAIIFVRTKTETVELAEKLEARGYATSALNGDMSQVLRERTVENMKNGTIDIVVATDVAARGLDVQRITHVINYDIPYDSEAYVHRIGRTGRAGRKGVAILFVAPREMRMLRVIEKATKQPILPMSTPTAETITHRRVAQFKQQIVDIAGSEDLASLREILGQIETEHGLTTRDIGAALAFLVQRERPLRVEPSEAERAPKAREQSGRRGEESNRQRPERGERASSRRETSDVPMASYRIEVGKLHGAMPKDIVGAIANEAGIESKYIGHIKLFDDFSIVDLPADIPADIFQHLKKVRIREHRLDIQLDKGPAGGKRHGDGRPDAKRARGSKNDDAGKSKSAKPRYGKKKPQA